MDESHQTISEVSLWVHRLGAGDPDARERLLEMACGRLTRLARTIKGDFPGVERWEQTDDIMQNASLRLFQALEKVDVADSRHFFRLAAVQIRRELIDLYRRYYGPHGLAAHHATAQPGEQGARSADSPGEAFEAAPSIDPQQIAQWSEMHEKVNELPEPEREVFDLLYYHGLPQAEAASILEVNLRTIKRRWRSAKLLLHAAIEGDSKNTNATAKTSESSKSVKSSETEASGDESHERV